MTDEIEKLRIALNKITPSPDPSAKAKNLRAALNNLEQAQGSANQQRPTSVNRPILGRVWTGVGTMLNSITSRGGLVTSTAIVAAGLIFVTPQGRNLLEPSALPPLTDIVAKENDVRLDGTSDEIEEFRGPLEEIVTLEVPTVAKRDRSDLASDADTLGMAEPVMDMAPMVEQSLAASQDFERKTIRPEENTETFSNAPESSLKVTADEPVSTFSADVDTASYAVVRSSINNGTLPPADAVRIEEMVNYFPYDYAAPDTEGAPFKSTVSVMPTPWNANTQLVHIALQGLLPEIDDRPALNLVFLIDTSGSMDAPNKLPLLKQSFRLLLDQLRPQDQVAIVTYAGSAGQVLEPTNASESAKIFAALDRLDAGGATVGQAGLEQAYNVAENMSADGEITRVLLATDGDFNVGISNPDALKDLIAKKRDSGTYLSVLGFGRGNLDDATMQALAQNGNGQAAYIDTLNEAQKVLVDQMSGALFPIANDVKIQVEFNPATVAEYRLIGYETRALRREDFNNDKIDAGEIGAGHTVTALYEITFVGSPATKNTELRYGKATQDAPEAKTDELGYVSLRYKTPGENVSNLLETPIQLQKGEPSPDMAFAASIAGFGQLLRGSNYLGDWQWDDAINLANSARGEDEFGYRAEAVALMRLAKSLSQN